MGSMPSEIEKTITHPLGKVHITWQHNHCLSSWLNDHNYQTILIPHMISNYLLSYRRLYFLLEAWVLFVVVDRMLLWEREHVPKIITFNHIWTNKVYFKCPPLTTNVTNFQSKIMIFIFVRLTHHYLVYL